MNPKPLRILKWGIYTLTLVTILVAAVGAWYLRPWIKPSQAHILGTWKIGDTHFQVWQRKNNDLAEAFATGLFVQNQNGQWQVYLLDFEDLYAPKIELKPDGSRIAVLRNGTKLGDFEPITAELKYPKGDRAFFPTLISNAPPADWWLGQ